MGYKALTKSWTTTSFVKAHSITLPDKSTVPSSDYGNEIRYTITIAENSNTLNWTAEVLTAYAGPNGSEHPATYISFKINGAEVETGFGNRYIYGQIDESWNNFPTKAGTSRTGAIILADNLSSIDISGASFVYYNENHSPTINNTIKEKFSETVYLAKAAEENSAGGSILISSGEGDGYIKIFVNGFIIGSGNEITETTITVQFLDDKGSNVGSSIIYNTTNEWHKGISIPADATKVYVKAKGKSKYGSDVIKERTSFVYTAPSIANLKLYWTSNSRREDKVPSGIKADAVSKLKDNITWHWSGIEPGINTPITGYRIFVYKSAGYIRAPGPSMYYYKIEDGKVKLKTNPQDNNGNPLSGNSLPLVENMEIDDGIQTNVFNISHTPGSNNLESATNGQGTHYLTISTNATYGSFSFNPKAAGFENKDYCIFEIIVDYNWKSVEEDTAASWHATPVTSEPDGRNCNCYFKNSANVWVKTADGADSSTWKEAESVWVKTDDGWREAEDLWIKTAYDTWSESS